MATVVLVHTGPRFPEHINDCIEQLHRYKHNVSVIISRNESPLLRGDVQKHIAEDLEDSLYCRFSSSHLLDRTTMGGFWERTSSRFFLLRALMETQRYQNILHIENDVLLFSDMSKEVEALARNCSVGLIMDAPARCIPSLLFFKNVDALNKVSEHILCNPTKTDMSNLASFFYENRDSAANLPIISESLDCFSTSQLTYSNLYDQLGTIFDGAAIGQYLGGIDPIHGKTNTIGFINETTVFDVSKFSFEWDRKEPYLRKGNDLIKISNLHMHSKNLRRFM